MPSGKKRKRHKVATKKFTKSSLKWQISNSLILPQENPENIV